MPEPAVEPPTDSHYVPLVAMLDVWSGLGGDYATFEEWMADPKRTPADAWAQLLAAIRGDLMVGDTNPCPGAILRLVWNRRGTVTRDDADWLRRCATAVRSLIEQVPAGRGRWADWVPEHLDRLADALDPPEADDG